MIWLIKMRRVSHLIHLEEGGCGASCGASFARMQQVIVEDVTKSPIFAGTPALSVMLTAEALACQSTPLLSHGQLVGMLNTHFRKPISEALRTSHDIKFDMGEIADFAMDEKEIRQLILNLSRNGFEAMKTGGRLTIMTYEQKGKVVLGVHDTGPGIPTSVLDKLGTPFTTTKENGTGLGLAVCYRIAERHDAKIDVRTSPDGTTFTISFPM